MIYLFRKFNKQIILANDKSAWDLFASDGQWKYRPIYLGAINDSVYLEKKQALEEAVPIEPGDYLKSRKNVLRPALAKRQKLEAKLYEELAALADKSITPTNRRVAVVQDQDKSIRPMSSAKIKNMIVGS